MLQEIGCHACHKAAIASVFLLGLPDERGVIATKLLFVHSEYASDQARRDVWRQLIALLSFYVSGLCESRLQRMQPVNCEVGILSSKVVTESRSKGQPRRWERVQHDRGTASVTRK